MLRDEGRLMDGPDGRPSKIPPSRSINSFLVRPPSSLGGKEGRSSCSCERAPCLGWNVGSARAQPSLGSFPRQPK